MKVLMFDQISEGVPSFGALPRGAWMALGILELVCTVGLVWVHANYGEITPIFMSAVLGASSWRLSPTAGWS